MLIAINIIENVIISIRIECILFFLSDLYISGDMYQSMMPFAT